jgi:hypothetical protein
MIETAALREAMLRETSELIAELKAFELEMKKSRKRQGTSRLGSSRHVFPLHSLEAFSQ